LFILHLPLVTW